ncbi:MAG: hypothetical protein KDA92_08695 [Planctomycetales bacterium]|nr:hypothetical protein [Planctomycetales bacterium]MCA9169267.1 hypothetical protein [Planctomycetales bacterium]
MSTSQSESVPLFGFVRISDLGNSGLIGGYLLLNLLGRPLEFHCTEPVKPNRAQQILYGTVLDAYLYGEQIAQTLVAHSRLQPALIFADQPAVLSLRSHCDVPVLMVDTNAGRPDDDAVELALGAHKLWISPVDAEQEVSIRESLSLLSAGWNLHEPFQRIEDAVAELQKAA